MLILVQVKISYDLLSDYPSLMVKLVTTFDNARFRFLGRISF